MNIFDRRQLFPICARCNRHVDEVVAWRDEARCCYVIIAKCHGEQEETILTDQIIINAQGLGMSVAFQKKELHEPK